MTTSSDAADVHSEKPPLDAANVHSEKPPLDAADIHSEKPALGAADIHLEKPSLDAANIHSEKPPSDAADIHSEKPPSNAANVHSEKPPSNTADIHSEKPPCDAADVHSEKPPSTPEGRKLWPKPLSSCLYRFDHAMMEKYKEEIDPAYAKPTFYLNGQLCAICSAIFTHEITGHRSSPICGQVFVKPMVKHPVWTCMGREKGCHHVLCSVGFLDTFLKTDGAVNRKPK